MTDASNGLPPLSPLTVTTEPSPRAGSPLSQAAYSPGLAFQRRGEGLIGLGEALRAEFSGPDRFDQASAWWSQLVDKARISDAIGRPGSGLVAFGAFTFADTSEQSSVLIVPEKIIGVDESGAFETTVVVDTSASTKPAADSAVSAEEALIWGPGEISEDRFLELVSRAKESIDQGGLHKVVIARDLVASAQEGFSEGPVLRRLAEAYPDTFVFAVDGLFGATPETLASVRDRSVSLRVLAGSSARGSNPELDQEQAQALATSTKDLDEHRFAVTSAIDSLAAVGVEAVADDIPFTLKLPNLWHLATDVVGQVPEGLGSLDVIRALHPTAAVAGSPTQQAIEFITTQESLDRGRYAGPVGWVDSNGNGDWAIALRCAQYNRDSGTLWAYAGAGIVADSDPKQELLETGLKFRPITEALY